VLAANQVKHVEIPCHGIFDHIRQGWPVEGFHIPRVILARRGVRDAIQAPGGRVGKRSHQVGIHDSERDDIQRNAERKCEDCCCGKDALLQERARGDPEFSGKFSHAGQDGWSGATVNTLSERRCGHRLFRARQAFGRPVFA
jgi:hypothetical protein